MVTPPATSSLTSTTLAITWLSSALLNDTLVGHAVVLERQPC